MQQMPKSVASTKGSINLCRYFWGDICLPYGGRALSCLHSLSAPGRHSQGFRGLILHTLGISLQGIPLQSARRNRSARDSLGKCIILLHPDSGHTSANRVTRVTSARLQRCAPEIAWQGLPWVHISHSHFESVPQLVVVLQDQMPEALGAGGAQL